MSEKDNSPAGIKRRSILRKAGAASIVAATLSGTASARTTETSGEQLSKEDRIRLVERHAGGVLEKLAEEQVLDQAHPSEFDFQPRATGLVHTGHGSTVLTVPSQESGRSRKLMVTKTLVDGTLNLVVDLQSHRVHAAYRNDTKTLIYREDSVVEPTRTVEPDCGGVCVSDACSVTKPLSDTYLDYEYDSSEGTCVWVASYCC